MNTTIEEQIKTNHEALLIATQSKESALKFLMDAGIIKKKTKPSQEAKALKSLTQKK